jgi:hypothetical protein
MESNPQAYLSYRPARLHRLEELIPGLLKILQIFRLRKKRFHDADPIYTKTGQKNQWVKKGLFFNEVDRGDANFNSPISRNKTFTLAFEEKGCFTSSSARA